MKCVSPFSITVAAPGTCAQVLLPVNSLDDPHSSINSVLPLGLDQWAAMYRQYIVVASTIYVKVHNVTSTGAVAYGLTLREPNETALLASCETYMENSKTRSRILSPDMDHSGVGISYNAKKYWRTPKLVTKEDLHGEFSTSPGAPASTAHVSFWYGDVNATEGFTIEGYITSVFTVLLREPIQPTRSAL